MAIAISPPLPQTNDQTQTAHRSEGIANNLLNHGYGFVKFTPRSEVIPKIMEGWNTFLNLPLEVRMKWRLGDPADWDDGYVARNGNGHDHKHFFHYRPHIHKLCDEAGVDYSECTEWFQNLNSLWDYCHTAFHGVMQELDDRLPGYDFDRRFLSSKAHSNHVVRLLSYNMPLVPGQCLGVEHSDRCFGTFQIYETHPALVLNLPSRSVDHHPIDGHALVFTGNKARDHTKGSLQGIRHSIIVPSTHTDNGNSGKPRQSIVFFAHIDI